ncbi:MAG: Gluconolactonase [Verrucomicrobia subdivision 3 bacterium]|nr:Gluconolactonase [Limisphaerales bacterium]MCS1414921.1 Gluconolactonase [Limisphaerales bacterium]
MNYSEIGLPEDTPPVNVATSVAFTEGPAVDADGNVFFSDIINNRILVMRPGGTHKVFRSPSLRTNGQTFDQQGRLYHCEGAEFGTGGGRRVTRTDLKTGNYEVLTQNYQGTLYNSPNDICIDGKGRAYFTDPCYWGPSREKMEMDIEGVYRIDPDGAVTRILEQPTIERPNGIAVTQDSAKLYIVDSCSVPGGNRKIWQFDLDADGNPSNQTLVWDFAPGRGADGMRLDANGTLYLAAGINTPRGPHETDGVPAGVYLITPNGVMKSRIPIPEDVITNLAFGGHDGKNLYITAGKNLYQTRVNVPGQIAYPKWSSE